MCLFFVFFFFCFFFQAEDGIRDHCVTGVQTCALPISQLVGNVLAAYGLGLVGQATVKLFASGFYAMRDTRTPVKIATSSLVVSTALAWLLMRWLGAPGIALGSSLGVFLNTSLHLYHLNGRIGAVLRGPEWRAFGISLLGAALAGAAAFGVARLTGGVAPVPRGVVVLGIFGIVYAALTLALQDRKSVV